MSTIQTGSAKNQLGAVVTVLIAACCVVACGPAGQNLESGSIDRDSPIGSVSQGVATHVFAANIDPNNGPAWSQSAPDRLRNEGFRGVRFVSRRSIQGKIDELKRAGLTVMAIITSESQGYVPWNADYSTDWQ